MNTVTTVIVRRFKLRKGDLFLDFLNITILKMIYVKAAFLNKYPVSLLSSISLKKTINWQGTRTDIRIPQDILLAFYINLRRAAFKT